MFEAPADMVTVADFNLDGFPELVIGRRVARELCVCSSAALERSTEVSRIALAATPVALASADLNQDGTAELVVALADATLQVLVAGAGLEFTLELTMRLPDIVCDLCIHHIGSQPALIVAMPALVQVVTAVESVQLGPPVSEPVDQAAQHLESVRQRAELRLDAPGMTTREREVIGLALTGLTARDIGTRLFIADRTVETHLAHAYAKLGVRSRLELIGRLVRDERRFA
jgi:DNA-binding CsgD family transcriptional regulator